MCEEQTTCSTVIEKIGYLFVLPVICLLGVCFNTIILMIFAQSSFRTQMTPSLVIYLTGLTITDLINSLIALPLGFIRCVHAPHSDVQYGYNLYEKYIWLSVGHMPITMSIWITLALTSERFLFLLNSGGEVTGQTVRKSGCCSGVALAGIIVTAIGFCIPLFFYYDPVTDNDSLQRSEFAKSLGYEIYSWIRVFIVQLIPIITVAALNFALIRIIKVSNEKLRYMVLPGAVVVKRIQSQNKTTIMLLSISSVFVLCNLLEPFSYVSVYTVIFGECSDKSMEFEIFRMFACIFQSVTYGSNFVSYCVFHNLFYSYVAQLFSRKSRRIECYPKNIR